MKIAVLGTGAVGQIIAEKLFSLGHNVAIGTRNITDALAREQKDMAGRPPFKEWHSQNSKIKLATYEEAAAFAELIVNATNGTGSLAALTQAGKSNLGTKILLDIANPLDFSKGFPPSLFVSNTDSLGEQIQKAFPALRVVKSLNTMTAYIMVNPALLTEDHNVFLSGNDSEAKEVIKNLLQSFGWKERNIIDVGDISTARGTEQLLPIWIRLYGALKNPMFNFKIVMGEMPKN